MHPENARRSPPTPEPHALPPLELLRSFEAAARTLSFTRAAGELFLTQSAVSRQIQQLEAAVGAPLFERRHRALALTEAGGVLQRAVVDSLERLRDATARIRSAPTLRQVAITCTPGFASFWLIPRLAHFTAVHPDVDVRVSANLEVMELERSRLDLAVRFVPTSRGIGPALFEESVVPLCAPQLVEAGEHPLRAPADLTHHTLLTIDMKQGQQLDLDWEPWLTIMGLPGLRMKNAMRFTLYTDAVNAAVAGQGVVIGRLPLLAGLLQQGRLVAPFGQSASSRRGYYIETSRQAAGNPDAQDFVRWLRAEAVEAANAAKAAKADGPARGAAA